MWFGPLCGRPSCNSCDCWQPEGPVFLSTLQISGFWDWRERLSPFSRPLCSECNSNRDSVLSYTSVRSNSSYLGSDEMGSGECDGGAGGGVPHLPLAHCSLQCAAVCQHYSSLSEHHQHDCRKQLSELWAFQEGCAVIAECASVLLCSLTRSSHTCCRARGWQRAQIRRGHDYALCHPHLRFQSPAPRPCGAVAL